MLEVNARSAGTHQATNADRDASFDRTALDSQLERIERSLEDGSWAERDFARLDRHWMPRLVERANQRKDGLDLVFLQRPAEFTDELSRIARDEIPASRYIVGLGDGGMHFAVLDVRQSERGISVLLFEPATLDADAPGMLAFQTDLAIGASAVPNVRCCKLELDLQRSHSECGVFSLFLAKKVHKASDEIEVLHRANLAKDLADVVGKDVIDTLLPATFFKHAQGKRRLEAYLQARPAAETAAVNKKGETLRQRAARTLVSVGGGLRSKSIHLKRLAEYRSLQQSLDGSDALASRLQRDLAAYGSGFAGIDSPPRAAAALSTLAELAAADPATAARHAVARDAHGRHLASRLAELLQRGHLSSLGAACVSLFQLLHRDGWLARTEVVAALLAREKGDAVASLAHAMAGANWPSNAVNHLCALLAALADDDGTRHEIVRRLSMTQTGYAFKQLVLQQSADFYKLVKRANRLNPNPTAIALLRQAGLIPHDRELSRHAADAQARPCGGATDYVALHSALTETIAPEVSRAHAAMIEQARALADSRQAANAHLAAADAQQRVARQQKRLAAATLAEHALDVGNALHTAARERKIAVYEQARAERPAARPARVSLPVPIVAVVSGTPPAANAGPRRQAAAPAQPSVPRRAAADDAVLERRHAELKSFIHEHETAQIEARLRDLKAFRADHEAMKTAESHRAQPLRSGLEPGGDGLRR